MVDYELWDLTDSLTVAQASCLWCEVEPSASFLYQKSKNSPIAAIEQMLVTEIRAGRLDADSTQNALSFIGDYSQSFVTRTALKDLAEKKGLTPKFLFTSARQPGAEIRNQNPIAVDTGPEPDSNSEATNQPAANTRTGRKKKVETKDQDITNAFDALVDSGQVDFKRGGLKKAKEALHQEFSDYEPDTIRKIIQARYNDAKSRNEK